MNVREPKAQAATAERGESSNVRRIAEVVAVTPLLMVVLAAPASAVELAPIAEGLDSTLGALLSEVGGLLGDLLGALGIPAT